MASSLQHFSIDSCLARIREKDPNLRAILLPLLDQAIKKSHELKARPSTSELFGVPYTLKDAWDTAGIRTSGGSWRHRNRVPQKSSRIHQALEELGAVLLGKSNCPDLSLPPETDNNLIGATCHPQDPARSPGGSSGGAAVAVATGMSAFDWGSDFGGSIRMPAAFCGIVGMRLSHVMWDPSDHFPHLPEFFKTFNGMGPLTSTIEDCRTLLKALESRLRTGAPAPFEVKKVHLYGPDEPAIGEWPTLGPDVIPALSRADMPFATADDLPSPSRIDRLYNVFLASHFDRFTEGDELPVVEGLAAVVVSLLFGPRGWGRKMHRQSAYILLLMALGFLIAWPYRRRARENVERLRRHVRDLWAAGGVILSPATTYSARPHGTVLKSPGSMAFAKIGNLNDATGLSIPWGRFPNGLPRSIQLLGPPGSEYALLDFAERLRPEA
ncbi:MAG: hypothetical protein HYT87_09935 [Nitrospirae bacterium]|nr:hypothetical protein [Nitrospirota bacterium]